MGNQPSAANNTSNASDVAENDTHTRSTTTTTTSNERVGAGGGLSNNNKRHNNKSYNINNHNKQQPQQRFNTNELDVVTRNGRQQYHPHHHQEYNAERTYELPTEEKPSVDMFFPMLRVLGKGSFGKVRLYYSLWRVKRVGRFEKFIGRHLYKIQWLLHNDYNYEYH